MRAWVVVLGIALIALTIYAVPTGIELALLRANFSPALCTLIGDLVGCVVLFLLGFRKTAIGIYVAATALELGCLIFRALPPRSVIFATNVAPTLTLCAVFVYVLSLDYFHARE